MTALQDGSQSPTKIDDKLIFSLWIGRELGPVEQLCLSALIRLGERVCLYSYEEVKGVPDGVESCDASEIVRPSEIFHRPEHGASFSGFSNLFRYEALSRFSGIWIDLDMLFVKPLTRESDFLVGLEAPGRANGAVLSYPPSSPLSEFLLRECRLRSQTNYKWGDLGPKLISEGLSRFGLWKHVAPRDKYYPIHFFDAWRLLDPESRRWVENKTSRSAGVHLWRNVFKASPVGDLAGFTPPKNSFLQASYSRHSITVPEGKPVPENWAEADWRGGLGTMFRHKIREIALHFIGLPAFRELNARAEQLSRRGRQKTRTASSNPYRA